jgi:hypothetical protein
MTMYTKACKVLFNLFSTLNVLDTYPPSAHCIGLLLLPMHLRDFISVEVVKEAFKDIGQIHDMLIKLESYIGHISLVGLKIKKLYIKELRLEKEILTTRVKAQDSVLLNLILINNEYKQHLINGVTLL